MLRNTEQSRELRRSTVGALLGLIIGLVAQAAHNRLGAFAGVGALVGAVVSYFPGIFILNRVLGLDYRRMR